MEKIKFIREEEDQTVTVQVHNPYCAESIVAILADFLKSADFEEDVITNAFGDHAILMGYDPSRASIDNEDCQYSTEWSDEDFEDFERASLEDLDQNIDADPPSLNISKDTGSIKPNVANWKQVHMCPPSLHSYTTNLNEQ